MSTRRFHLPLELPSTGERILQVRCPAVGRDWQLRNVPRVEVQCRTEQFKQVLSEVGI